MAKRVRFLDPPSSSLSTTSSTLAEFDLSPNPSTPSSTRTEFDLSPNPPPPSPYDSELLPNLPGLYADVSPQHMEIHSLLAYAPFSDPPLHYDITTHPALTQDKLSADTLADPATNPPMTTLTVVKPDFPWSIFIRPAPNSSGSFVTVADVLHAIYHNLRLTVSRIEYESVPSDQAHHVGTAYLTRVGQVLGGNAREQERCKGVKRVDFLMGENFFMGLSDTLSGPDIWELNVCSQQSGATSFERSAPVPSSIPPMLPISKTEDDHEQRRATSSEPSAPVPNSIPPISEMEDKCEQSGATSSARMFDHARNLNINGGEIYNTAGSLNIDVRHDASTHSTSVTHLWQHQQACNQVFLPINVEERLDGQIQGNTGDNELSCDKKPCASQDGPTSKAGADEHCQNDSLPCSPLDTTCLDTDRIILDTLSSYPRLPIGDPHSFGRIIKALLFALSPLSPMMIAALLRLDNARHVERILKPASPLIFMPKLDNNQTPVQFIDKSIVDFLLDRARSGKYFVDSSLGHRVLLDGCNLVMEKVYRDSLRLDSVDCQWRDAYEYACRNWETHRRASARSKL